MQFSILYQDYVNAVLPTILSCEVLSDFWNVEVMNTNLLQAFMIRFNNMSSTNMPLYVNP